MLGIKSNLSFRGIKSVFLSYEKKQIIEGRNQWLYYGSDKIYFNRVTEPKKLSPYVSPENKSYLTAEITYSKGVDLVKSMGESAVRAVTNCQCCVGI